MKTRFLLALLMPVAAFIISCGPVDMQDPTNNAIDAQVIEENVDSTDLNLGDNAKNDWWLGLYIPSAFGYYQPPFFWGSYYPNPCWDFTWSTFFGPWGYRYF